MCYVRPISLLHERKTARDFLESREGFAAAGRRALRDVDGGWMAKAATDDTFTSNEKAELGLPEVVADISRGGSDIGGVETRITADNPHESSIKGGQNDPFVGEPQAPASGHHASAEGVTANETVLSSSGGEEAPVTETEVGGDDSQSGLPCNAEKGALKTGCAAERAASAGSSVVSASESAQGGGTSSGGQEKLFDQEDSTTELNVGEGSVGHSEHVASVSVQRRGGEEGRALDSGSEGRATTDSR